MNSVKWSKHSSFELLLPSIMFQSNGGNNMRATDKNNNSNEANALNKEIDAEFPIGTNDDLFIDTGNTDNDFYATLEKSILNYSNPSTNVLTELKEAEEDLRKIRFYIQKFMGKTFNFEEKFRSLLENSYDVIYQANLVTGTMEYISPSVERVLGYYPEEVIGHTKNWIGANSKTNNSNPDTYPFKPFVHPEDYQKLVDHIVGVKVASRETNWDFDSTLDFRVKHKKFGYRWVCNTHTIVLDQEDKHVAVVGNIRDINKRKEEEEKLQRLYNELEEKVKERTVDLEEANAAMSYLLKKTEKDKNQLEEHILLNIKELITPTVDKLKKNQLNSKIKKHIEILETNLNHIASSLCCNLTSKYYNLTHNEIQIVNLIMNGKTTKEIATIINLSTKTIDFYRLRIRKKLGITNQKESLRSHLLSLQG